METDAKGWSVPTCSQEEPWRAGERGTEAAWARLCHPESRVPGAASSLRQSILSSNCPQSPMTPQAMCHVHLS